MAPVSDAFVAKSPSRPADPRAANSGNLRPAPLRISQRKSGRTSDGAEVAHSPTRMEGLASTASSQHPQTQDSSEQLVDRWKSQRRPAAPKLQSLVSKFEVTGAPNSVKPSTPSKSVEKSKPKTSAIPRASFSHGLKVPITRRSHHSINSSEASVESSVLSPHQARSPQAARRKSLLPVKTKLESPSPRGNIGKNQERTAGPSKTKTVGTAKPTSRGLVSPPGRSKEWDPRLVADRRKLFEQGVTYSPFSKPSTPNIGLSTSVSQPTLPVATSPSPHPSSARSLVSKSSHRDLSPRGSVASSRSATVPKIVRGAKSFDRSSHGPAQDKKPNHEVGRDSSPKKLAGREQPSVADLRKSFEQKTQPSQSPKITQKSKLRPKPSVQFAQIPSQDVSPPSASTHYSKGIPPATPVQTRSEATSKYTNSPPSTAGQGHREESRSRVSEWSSPIAPKRVHAYFGADASTPGSQLLRQGAELGTLNNPNHVPSRTAEHSRSQDTNSKETRQTTNLSTWMDGCIEAHSSCIPPFSFTENRDFALPLRSDSHVMRPDAETPSRARPQERSVPQSEPIKGYASKVADLRRLFDRPSIPLLSFRNNHGQSEPMKEPRESGSRWHSVESTTTLSTHATVQRIRAAPSLTTEISINDFSCNFPGSLEFEREQYEQSPRTVQQEVPAAPEKREESPVKARIRQFENLDQASTSALGDSKHPRAKSHNTGLHFAFRSGRGEKPAAGGWRPIRDRGTAIWRRISNSLAHSMDSCRSSDVVEKRDAAAVGDEKERPRRPPLPPDDGTAGRGFFQREKDYWSHHHRSSSSSIFGYHHHRSNNCTSSRSRCPRRTYLSSETSGIATDGYDYNENGDDDEEPDAHRGGHGHGHGHVRMTTERHPSVRRSFPYFARPGRETPVFGLDGAMASKPNLAVAAAEDDDPLLTSSSVAERKRRKREEKALRREHKKNSQKRDGKDKDDKGKGKAVVAPQGSSGEAEQQQPQGRSREAEQPGGNRGHHEWTEKTESGFVVGHAGGVKLNHPRPRRPGQVKKIVNMYKEKSRSGGLAGLGLGGKEGERRREKERDKGKGKGKEKERSGPLGRTG
ncbi:hypothetical protein F4780DRAFT_506354 [Xylariomycetidae sp. FL0641]|nr:hypothetical protein F4780DRAFT_506354 [Xylariomycetidae sp. FL0641]